MKREELEEILRTELTARQRQVIEQLLSGHSVTETARLLGVRPSTVTRTRDRAYIRIDHCLGYRVRKRRLDKAPWEE